MELFSLSLHQHTYTGSIQIFPKKKWTCRGQRSQRTQAPLSRERCAENGESRSFLTRASTRSIASYFALCHRAPLWHSLRSSGEERLAESARLLGTGRSNVAKEWVEEESERTVRRRCRGTTGNEDVHLRRARSSRRFMWETGAKGS